MKPHLVNDANVHEINRVLRLIQRGVQQSSTSNQGASASAGSAPVAIVGPAGPTGPQGVAGATGATGPNWPVKDDGAIITPVPAAMNFTGPGVTVTDVGGVATVSIPGGGNQMSIPFWKSDGTESDILANWLSGSAYLPFWKSSGVESDIPLV